MRYIYSKWTPHSLTDENRLEALMGIFFALVIRVNGDAEEALEWLRYLDEQNNLLGGKMTMEEFIEKLKEKGFVVETDGKRVLTQRGAQRLRRDALAEIFTSLKKSSMGMHETPSAGSGIDKMSETRPFAFGDHATNIDVTQTLTNAFINRGIESFSLYEDDIEVYETENLVSQQC
jgi:Ca-activated chloride channel family protein